MTAENSPETSLITRTVKRLTGSSHAQKVPQPQTDKSLPVTETLKTLVRERRRIVISEIANAEQFPLSTSTLADRVACKEYQCDSQSLTSEQEKRVHIALVQSHLPRLDEANVITYNTGPGYIERGSRFDQTLKAYIAIVNSLNETEEAAQSNDCQNT